MTKMYSGSSPFLRSFLLFLAVSLSLGSLPCVAAGMDDIGSPPACCARDDDAGDDDLSGVPSDALSACFGACPGTAMATAGAMPVGMSLAAHSVPPHSHFLGRTLAPDPHPPRHHSSV